MKAIAMKCSEEQFNKIKSILEKSNHVKIVDLNGWDGPYIYLTNNLSNRLGIVSNVDGFTLHRYNREIHYSWNEKVFLEACDIKCDEESEIPEYVECVTNHGTQFTEGKIYKTIPSDCRDEWYRIEEDNEGDKNGWASANFKPSTKEAFEKQNNNKVMLKQKLTISITDVMKIHAIACTNWKSKIASTYLPRVDKDQNIKFTQDEIDEMFGAASENQKVTLEEVFGKQTSTLKDIADGREFFSSDTDSMIQLRTYSNLKNKAFWLHPDYNWELKRDDSNQLCLVPTLKD